MNTIEFYGRYSMSEFMRSQGIEVAGEDYSRSQREGARDQAKETVAERLEDLVDDILMDGNYMRSAHGRLCSKIEVWQWIEDISRRKKKRS